MAMKRKTLEFRVEKKSYYPWEDGFEKSFRLHTQRQGYVTNYFLSNWATCLGYVALYSF